MKRQILIYCLLIVSFGFLHASRVDTLITKSEVMNKQIKAVVVTPDSYDGTKVYPVIYTLHGYSGNYSDWVKNVPDYKNLADQYQVILVSPDGKNSWYWDSPINPASQYETYITKELIPQIDAAYKTVKSPKGRAITGLSMGGHGALYLAIRHQDTFGAAGSMSGGVDIRSSANKWEMKKYLGSYEQNKSVWAKHTVINMIDQIVPGSLRLIIDCGTDDFFYKVNMNFHAKLEEKNIPHEFMTPPGGHTWSYWSNAILHQVAFMHDFFKENNLVPQTVEYFFDDEVTLTGKVTKFTYTNLTGESYYSYLLDLNQPITVISKEDKERNVYDIQEIQLNLTLDDNAQKQYSGKTITVKGTIYPESTVHDRRPVIMVSPEIVK